MKISRKILLPISLVPMIFIVILSMDSTVRVPSAILLFCFSLSTAIVLFAMIRETKQAKKQHDKIKLRNFWLKYLFGIYCIFLIMILFFHGSHRKSFDAMGITILSNDHFKTCNFIPFATIEDYIHKAVNRQLNWTTAFANVFLNIVLFMPMGFFFATIFSVKINHLGKCLLTVFTIAFSAEMIQFLTFCGVFDVDDILLNIFGASIIYFLMKINLLKKS